MPRPSTGEYPSNWPEIAEAVKRAAGWKCIRCGEAHNIAEGYMLTVHHIDLNKSNCEWWNLAALCQRCHLQIQHKVIIERLFMFEHTDWFKPYVAGYYAFKNNLPHDKAFVMAHLEQLLDFGRPVPLYPPFPVVEFTR
jgi:hypothetical protein